jgi:uncharacterized protein YndB with AHSA1/START domain
MKNRTTGEVERAGRPRTFNGPRIVFEAWTKPELFRQWWVPQSMGMSLLSCEMDVRVGRYRLSSHTGTHSRRSRHVQGSNTLAPRLDQ